MRKRTSILPVLVAGLALTACGPTAWNQHAEYLPAPNRTEESLQDASIQEYVAELPPSSALEPDSATLRSRVNSAPSKSGSEWSRLTLVATEVTPRRDFLLNHRSKTLRMTVSRNSAVESEQVHYFQRQKSDWYHWIQGKTE